MSATPGPARSQLTTAAGAAVIAALFMACVGSAMIYQRIMASSSDPWKSPQLLELKEKLRESPKDELIKARIRELDLKFRQQYFRRLALDRTGGWLLLAGAVVLVTALTTVHNQRKLPPLPRIDREAAKRAAREAAWSRRAVAIAGGVVAGALVAVAFGVRSSLDDAALAALAKSGAPGAGGSGPGAAPALPLPPQEEFLANWPRFRGPLGGGIAARPDAPLTWDGKSGNGVIWKAAVPAPGFNSPIVWGDRIFLSGATEEKREILCYSTTDGRLLWQRAIELPPPPGEPPHISEETGYAASTMATDGRHAYAIFGNGDLAAVTFDGRIAWAKNLGSPKNPYGHATSLAIWQGRLIVQFDQGESRPHNSRIIVFDGANGKVLWEKPRQMVASWATPIVIEAAGRTQIITLGAPWVVSYALADGATHWRAEILEGEICPSPIYAGGLLMIVYPDNKMMALKPDGTGELHDDVVLWKGEDHIPDVTTPVSNGELAFTVTSRGAIACYDVKDGKMLWEKELRTDVHASPVIAGNRLYILCSNGTTVVAEVGREYKELAKNELGDKIYASPAIVGGRMFVRSLNHLYCFGAAAPAAPGT